MYTCNFKREITAGGDKFVIYAPDGRVAITLPPSEKVLRVLNYLNQYPQEWIRECIIRFYQKFTLEFIMVGHVQHGSLLKIGFKHPRTLARYEVHADGRILECA
jgi:hypothetical protein